MPRSTARQLTNGPIEAILAYIDAHLASRLAIIDPAREVNPLANWIFTASSCLLIMAIAMAVTPRARCIAASASPLW